MDYTTLISGRQDDGSIKNWVNDSLVPVEQLIVDAENWIARRLRVREMRTRKTGTLSIGTETLATPTRYLGSTNLVFTGIYKAEVKRQPEHEIIAAYGYDGDGVRVNAKPRTYYVDKANFYFNSPPDIAYPYLLTYYEKIAELTDTLPTNVLTDSFSYLLRCVLLFMANEFLKDTGEESRWRQKGEAEIVMLNRETDMEREGEDLVIKVE